MKNSGRNYAELIIKINDRTITTTDKGYEVEGCEKIFNTLREAELYCMDDN